MNRVVLAVLSLSLAAPLAFADSSDKEADEALSAFKKAYSSREESARISAVEALGSVQHRRVVEALAAPLAKDPSPAVRRAAAAALGGQWTPGAAGVLGRALDAENAPRDVTAAIIAALGRTESDEAVPHLVALLGVRNQFATDNDGAAFTAAALDALGKIGSVRALEDILGFLSQEANVTHLAARARLGPEPLIKHATDALAAITGQQLKTAAQWRVWWSENKRALKEIPVFRCPQTGRTFDRPEPRVKCPFDGDQHAGCGRFLKTRLEGGGLGAPDPAPEHARKGAKKN